jgi:eukaryotic-like serine/threonine-protein kinase
MPYRVGARVGPYEIVGPLGAGGMGEVYLARDTRLQRDIAIKTLPDAFTADPDRLSRFQREAQLLASLNHPNIAAIYGIEESDGQRALILELVDGETLAERLAMGPVPLEDAIPIANQIAAALEAAHERGIIHRDLKPANIKLTPNGRVKVLDFGLAKALDTAAKSAGDPANSPTLTAHATELGLILGTAA